MFLKRKDQKIIEDEMASNAEEQYWGSNQLHLIRDTLPSISGKVGTGALIYTTPTSQQKDTKIHRRQRITDLPFIQMQIWNRDRDYTNEDCIPSCERKKSKRETLAIVK